MADYEDGRYEIASVLSRATQAIGANLPLFAGLSLVLSAIPAFLFSFWQLESVQIDVPGEPLGAFQPWMVARLAIGWLISLVAGAVLQAALTRATVQHLSGERPDFARCLTVGLRLFLPLVAISFIYAIGLFFGFLLLIVPGIILAMMWAVTVPAYVQERIGIFEAFTRSGELTRGARWRIFLTFLVLIFGLWLLSIPVGLFTAGLGSASASIPLAAAITAVTNAIGTMVMTAVQASIYVELREVKEGVAPADLEAIFA